MRPGARSGRAARPQRGPDLDPRAAPALADRARPARRARMEPNSAPSPSTRPVSEPPFDPLAGLRALVDRSVRFVLIGGYAAALRGSPMITGDVDVCHARDTENLERLA